MVPDALHDALAASDYHITQHERAITVLQRAQGDDWPNVHSHRLAEHRYARHMLTEWRQHLVATIHFMKAPDDVQTIHA